MPPKRPKQTSSARPILSFVPQSQAHNSLDELQPPTPSIPPPPPAGSIMPSAHRVPPSHGATPLRVPPPTPSMPPSWSCGAAPGYSYARRTY